MHSERRPSERVNGRAKNMALITLPAQKKNGTGYPIGVAKSNRYDKNLVEDAGASLNAFRPRSVGTRRKFVLLLAS